MSFSENIGDVRIKCLIKKNLIDILEGSKNGGNNFQTEYLSSGMATSDGPQSLHFDHSSFGASDTTTIDIGSGSCGDTGGGCDSGGGGGGGTDKDSTK